MKKVLSVIIFLFMALASYPYEIIYKAYPSRNWKTGFLKHNPKVTLMLPADYETSGKKYPVIYALDGQNLFDEKYAFSGEWKLDETIQKLFHEDKIPQVIVVAIHNTANRLNDYTPTYAKTERYGSFGGDLFKTESFILQELKPFIEEKFPVSPLRKNNYLMGSSLGGLTVFYILGRNSNLFRGAFCISSSFWWDQNRVLKDLKDWDYPADTRIFLSKGWYEDPDRKGTVHDTRDVYLSLKEKGMKDAEQLWLYEDPGGTHSESSWARQLHIPLTWVFNTEKLSPLSLEADLDQAILIQDEPCIYQPRVIYTHDLPFTIAQPKLTSPADMPFTWNNDDVIFHGTGDTSLALSLDSLRLTQTLHIYSNIPGIFHREIHLSGNLKQADIQIRVISQNQSDTNYTILPAIRDEDKIIFRISYPENTRMKIRFYGKNNQQAYSASGKPITRTLKFKKHSLTRIKVKKWK